MSGISCALIARAIESGCVIELRLAKLSLGGPAAWIEAQVMVAEKVMAAGEAAGTLMSGGSPERVIAHYREHVAANDIRLRA